MKTSQRRLCREISAVCSGKHKKTNSLFGQNIEFMNKTWLYTNWPLVIWPLVYLPFFIPGISIGSGPSFGLHAFIRIWMCRLQFADSNEQFVVQLKRMSEDKFEPDCLDLPRITYYGPRFLISCLCLCRLLTVNHKYLLPCNLIISCIISR